MGCNCGDNEYEIIVDNNGSCEPTTPEYYITLENVGVDGFSPTINQVNVTSSSFQLQITDVNGTETTGDIPLLSYLNNNFVTNTDLADTLTAYVTSTSLATTLTNYITNTSLATTLADYVTNSNLTTTLTNYVTNSSLSSTLNNYVTNSSLSSTLSAYALDANVVHKTGTEVISGNKVFSTIYTYRIVGNSNNTSMSIDTYSGGQNLYIGAGEASFIQIGNNYQNNSEIRLIGDTVTLNGKDIATVDQIPTVGNGTITITQGGVSKGTFTTNQSGNTTIALDAGGGGSSYTAGTGIDITNDTISIDTSVVAQLSDIPDTSDMATKTWVGNQGYLTSADLPTNYVTTDTAQTITGVKTFNDNIKLNNGKAILTQSNYEALSVVGEDVSIGNDSGILWLWSSGTRPIYNLSGYLALYSDIPTVNNPTITFTQGGVSKGTITLNQSSNQTIALDAGGGGGVTIDDTTPSTTKVYSSQKTQDLIDAKEDKFIVGEGIVLEEITHAIPNDLTSETSSSIVYADGYEGTYYPYMAFDGDENTKWGLFGSPSEQNPHWLVRDLGNTYPIARVVIKTESSNEVITGGYVQGSNDAATWTNIGIIDNSTDLTKTITCNSTNRYRYIRLYCTSAKSGWGKVNEMIIYTGAVMTLSISPTILNQITDLQNRIAILEANINGGNA